MKTRVGRIEVKLMEFIDRWANTRRYRCPRCHYETAPERLSDANMDVPIPDCPKCLKREFLS